VEHTSRQLDVMAQRATERPARQVSRCSRRRRRVACRAADCPNQYTADHQQIDVRTSERTDGRTLGRHG